MNADFIAKSKCSLISISAEDLKVIFPIAFSFKLFTQVLPYSSIFYPEKKNYLVFMIQPPVGMCVGSTAGHAPIRFHCHSATCGEGLLLLGPKSGVKRIETCFCQGKFLCLHYIRSIGATHQ
jgi:hypothetical protein